MWKEMIQTMATLRALRAVQSDSSGKAQIAKIDSRRKTPYKDNKSLKSDASHS